MQNLTSVEPKILYLDKPTGMTSHDVVALVRKKTGVKRVGHSGTLDPLATGLLIILIGREATKLQDSFLKQDKEYLCTAELGKETDTYDSDGTEINTTPWDQVREISEAQISQILPKFKGEIQQTVPAYSAVKIHGQKLYDLARKGQTATLELPVRTVHIFELQLLEFNRDENQHVATLTVRVSCSSGTYIRSLLHDIGKLLGVGATVTALRRTKIGQHSLDEATTLTDFLNS